MASRGGKRRSRSAGGGLGSKIWGFAVTLIALGLALAFLRSNGITDVDSAMTYFRGIGNEASEIYPDKIKKAVSKSCNFIKDPSCLYSKSTQSKIGDVNADGVVNDLDSEEYAKENGVSVPNRQQDNGTDTRPNTPVQGGTGTNEMIAKLNTLEVAEPDKSSKYSRADYKHWVNIEGACDAREESLKMVGFATDARTCKAKAGFNYIDPYTGNTVNDPRKLDIDHIIPLGYVNAHNGAGWSPEKKQQYANDVQDVLIPADASSNRQKGDKGPAGWMPSNKTYYCGYASKWVNIASKYGISITQADKGTLTTALQSCEVK